MKKVFSVLLAMVMLSSIISGVNLNVAAQGQGESVLNPYYYNIGDVVAGGIYDDGDDLSGDVAQYYRFTLTQSGLLTFDFSSSAHCIYFKILANDGKTIVYNNNNDWFGTNENFGRIQETIQMHITAGTFYICISQWLAAEGSYYIQSSFNAATESFPENDGKRDDFIDSANNISFNTNYAGLIGANDETDFYAISMPFASDIKISVNQVSTLGHMKMYVLNQYGNEISEKTIYNNNGVLSGEFTCHVDNGGIYYIKLYCETFHYGTGIYTFNVEMFCNHEYSRNYYAPTYFNKGYTEFICQKCGYTYRDGYTAKLKVTKPAVSKFKRGKKKVTVYLNNIGNADGVQIQYSTSKKFTKKKTKTVATKKTSKTIKKLKSKKKYYVRVRSYKTVKVNGKSTKVYSNWSKVKSVKTK